MSGPLFSLRQVTLPASGGRQSPGNTSPAVKKHDRTDDKRAEDNRTAQYRGIDIPRSPGTRLNSITLNIASGVTAVVGLSGAGKTSLINVLAGFETQFSGDVKTCIPDDQPHRLPLFWVPQSGGLWPHLSAEQHLNVVSAEVPQNSDSRSEFGRFSKRTDELLRLFDLNHRRQALPAELSQGERSRLALARALATRAKVLLLDEPLSHVDPVRKPAFWKIVRQVVAEENVSMVFTSHEPETVLRQAERVICLNAGAVAYDGSVRVLYDNPPNAEIGEFLGPLNWFSVSESLVFLNGKQASGDRGIRPERLTICVASESESMSKSALELVSIPFNAAYCEAVIRHVESGMTKTVLHQVPDCMPSIGDSVILRPLEPAR